MLTGFVALPSDFQRLITAAIFLLVGIASGLYVAFAPEEKQSRAIALGFIAFATPRYRWRLDGSTAVAWLIQSARTA